MKRRDFFKRIGGVAVAAAVAPHVLNAAPGMPSHVEYGVSFEADFNDEQFRRYARLLAESARRREERLMLSVLNNGFTG